MRHTIPAVMPPVPRDSGLNKRYAPSVAGQWLAAGWRDLMAQPAPSLLYGLGVFVVSAAVVFGLVEFGRAIMVEQTLVSSAREACRVAVLAGTTKQDVIDRATASLNAAGIGTFTVTMNPDPPSGAAEGTAVTVTIKVSFNNVSWLPVPIYLNGKNLSASSVMRREWD